MDLPYTPFPRAGLLCHVCTCCSGAVGTIEALAIGSKAGSWRLAAFHTAPEFEDATPDDKLKLGEHGELGHVRLFQVKAALKDRGLAIISAGSMHMTLSPAKKKAGCRDH